LPSSPLAALGQTLDATKLPTGPALVHSGSTAINRIRARTNRPIAQLTIYALALAHRTGLKLFDIKCAWFNENEYCEFFPRKLFTARDAIDPMP